MQPIDVRVHDVEIFDPLRDRLKQSGACDRRIGDRSAKPERAGPHRIQVAAGAGIFAREQGHLVAQADELVNQPGDYPLCRAVKLGRNALGQGRDLGNPHDSWSGPLLIGDHATTTKTYRVFPTPLPIFPGFRKSLLARSRPRLCPWRSTPQKYVAGDGTAGRRRAAVYFINAIAHLVRGSD